MAEQLATERSQDSLATERWQTEVALADIDYVRRWLVQHGRLTADSTGNLVKLLDRAHRTVATHLAKDDHGG